MRPPTPPPIQMPLARTGENNNRCIVFLSFFDNNPFVTTFWNDATRWEFLFLWGVTLRGIMGATAHPKSRQMEGTWLVRSRGYHRHRISQKFHFHEPCFIVQPQEYQLKIMRPPWGVHPCNVIGPLFCHPIAGMGRGSRSQTESKGLAAKQEHHNDNDQQQANTAAANPKGAGKNRRQ